MPYDYDAQSILARLMDGLQSDANRLQGGFCADNLQAVAEELARYRAMILEYAVEQTMLDTAEGEYLDRKALEYNEARRTTHSARGCSTRSGSRSPPAMPTITSIGRGRCRAWARPAASPYGTAPARSRW